MRQSVITRHGGPDVLQMQERADPSPGDGEVRIRVRAAGVNFADVLAPALSMRLAAVSPATQPASA
jgi:NADPH:quinone reductase-like Zn-dependent oxidoreductase